MFAYLGSAVSAGGEGEMQEFLLIALLQGVILLALWRWDEHARRVERRRRHLENRQRQASTTASYAA